MIFFIYWLTYLYFSKPLLCQSSYRLLVGCHQGNGPLQTGVSSITQEEVSWWWICATAIRGAVSEDSGVKHRARKANKDINKPRFVVHTACSWMSETVCGFCSTEHGVLQVLWSGFDIHQWHPMTIEKLDTWSAAWNPLPPPFVHPRCLGHLSHVVADVSLPLPLDGWAAELWIWACQMPWTPHGKRFHGPARKGRPAPRWLDPTREAASGPGAGEGL